MCQRPRLVPGIAFPPYSYVPGRFPHPFSDPLGHHFGHDLGDATAPDSRHFLLGLDLFNHGYYWEAHEAWESLWHAHGRRGVAATFFKALIQWCVVGVKAREQRPEGVTSHAKRAKELFAEVASAIDGDSWMGLSLPELIAHADAVIANPPTCGDPTAVVEIVFPFVLSPRDAVDK